MRVERSLGSLAGGGWETCVVRQAVRANLLERYQALQKLTQAETASKRNELGLLPKSLTLKLTCFLLLLMRVCCFGPKLHVCTDCAYLVYRVAILKRTPENLVQLLVAISDTASLPS